MINFRGDFKAVGHVLKDSWQRKNPLKKKIHQGIWHTLVKISQGMRKFRRVCENFVGYAKPFSNSKVNYCQF